MIDLGLTRKGRSGFSSPPVDPTKSPQQGGRGSEGEVLIAVVSSGSTLSKLVWWDKSLPGPQFILTCPTPPMEACTSHRELPQGPGQAGLAQDVIAVVPFRLP